MVYPAAGFVHDAKCMAHTIEINLFRAVESEFEEKRYGKASIEVPKLVSESIVIERLINRLINVIIVEWT